MKTLISFLIMGALVSAPAVFAADMSSHMGQGTMKDGCAMMKDNKMMTMKDGQMMPMDKDMTMSNGDKVMMDGRVMMKDGKEKMMKDGDMMDMDGKMSMKGSM